MKKIKNIYNRINDYWDKFINLKYINIIFKFLPHNLLLFLLFIISLFTIFNIYKNNHYEFLYSQEVSDTLGEPLIIYPQYISFENVELKGTPDKICFKFAAYARKNNALIDLTILKGDEWIYNVPIDGRIITDEIYCEKIPEVLNNDNIKEYRAMIRPLQTDSYNTVTLYRNSETNEPTMFFARSLGIFSIRNIITYIVILFFLFLNYLINKKKLKVENVWILFAGFYIVPLTILIPPYQVPDETVHFYNAYKMSQLDFSKSLKENFDNNKIEVPSNLKKLNYSLYQKSDKVYDSNKIFEALENKENEMHEVSPGYLSTKSKIGYIFSSIGIKIGDILSNSPAIIFYLGRLFNMLASVFIIFYAIKKTPKYKELFLLVATIPMFIQGMISYSYDSILNSLILLAVSVMLRLIYGEKINIKLTIILIMCGIFISNIKYIYLPVFLLLLFLPDKDKNKKYYKWLYCIGIILVSYFIGKLTRNVMLSNGAATGIEAISNKSSNMQYILNNPLMVFPIAFNTFKVNGFYYLKGIFGYFGWFKYGLDDLFIYSYLIIIVYLILSNEAIKSNKVSKIINIIGYLISFGAVFASMYFLWSSNNLDYVDGVQGRYFLPIVLSFIIILLPKKAKIKLNINNIYFYINIILLQYMMIILMYYY